jgi:hypothetical protein
MSSTRIWFAVAWLVAVVCADGSAIGQGPPASGLGGDH